MSITALYHLQSFKNLEVIWFFFNILGLNISIYTLPRSIFYVSGIGYVFKFQIPSEGDSVWFLFLSFHRKRWVQIASSRNLCALIRDLETYVGEGKQRAVAFLSCFLKNLFYWNIVDLQCCVSFWCIAKWFSYTYTASQVVLVVKNLPANAGDVRGKDPIPGWGRSPREGHGSPLQYSCLEHPRHVDWHATVFRVAKSWTWLKWLNTTIPNSQSILLLSWKPQVCLLCLWICFCFIDVFCVIF